MSVVEYWAGQTFGQMGPFFHSEDVQGLTALPTVHWNGWDQACQQIHQVNENRGALHLGLLPSPFAGNPIAARVVLVLKNPGLSALDYYAEDRCPDFRQASIDMLAGNFDTAYPFIFLNPQWAWTGGGIWWNKKLAPLINSLKVYFAGSYTAARQHVAQNLAVVEALPYHSKSGFFSVGHYNLPSAQEAKRYVRDELVPSARNGQKAVVVMRGATYFDLEEPGHAENGLYVYPPAAAQTASLNPTSPGGGHVMRWLVPRGKSE